MDEIRNKVKRKQSYKFNFDKNKITKFINSSFRAN